MIIPTKEQVVQAYVTEKLSTRQCAERFEMSQPWFIKYMSEYGVIARKPNEYDGSNKGKRFSEEHKRKMSVSIKGRKMSQEFCEKIKQSWIERRKNLIM